MNLAPGFQSLSSHIVQFHLKCICGFIQIEYQNESYYKITLDYCINIFMILIKYLNYRANTV